MALKKEDRLFGYSEKIGVNRGGGFQFASQVAQSQANDIDNLVTKFADAGLKDLQQFGEAEAKKAVDNYEFGSSQQTIFNPVTNQNEVVSVPTKIKLPDTLPTTKTAIESFEKDIYDKYKDEIFRSMETIAIDERTIAEQNYSTAGDYEKVVDAKFAAVFENVSPKFKELAERYGTKLINQHGFMVGKNKFQFDERVNNSSFTSDNVNMRDSLMTDMQLLGPNDPSVKLQMKEYENMINKYQGKKVVAAIANGKEYIADMKAASKVYGLFEKFNLDNVDDATTIELTEAAQNYRDIALVVSGIVDSVELTSTRIDSNGKEVKVTETFDSTTIGNLIGGKGKLKSEIQQQYDKIAARLESRLTGKTKSLTSMNSWKVNYNRNSKGMTSIDGERTSKERNEEWNNPELVRVWMADYNKDSPNQPITEEEVNSGSGENYFRFVKYVAAIDNKLPPKVFESIESAYEGNAVSEIESFRNSSLISFLYNKSLYIDDGTGTMKEVPVSSMQNFGFSRMTENKMIAIERGLLINPNLQEVVDNVKERFDKFNKEGGMTLIEALQNASNNKYSNIGDIDKQIMKSINSTIEQNFLGIGDVSFPTILFSEVKKEIYAGLLEGGIIFNNLSDIDRYVKSALAYSLSDSSAFGFSKIGYSKFTGVGLDEGEFEKYDAYVLNPVDKRYTLPKLNKDNTYEASVEYLNKPIMDIVKKSADYPNIKAFKPELGKNIRLESVQTEGSQFPTYYVVFVNQDGQAERLQNDLGLNIIYNPKEDYEAAKAKLPLELQNVNNFEEFKKMRVLELEGAVAIPKGLNPKSTHFFEDGSILYKGKLYKNSAELKAANKKK